MMRLLRPWLFLIGLSPLAVAPVQATTSLFNAAAFTTTAPSSSLSGSITWNDDNADGFVVGTEISEWSFRVVNDVGSVTMSNASSFAAIVTFGRGFYIVPGSGGDLSWAKPIPAVGEPLDRLTFSARVSAFRPFVDFWSARATAPVTLPRIATEGILNANYAPTPGIVDPVIFTAVTAIPEPSNWAMMAAGLGALLGWRGLSAWRSRRS